MPGQVTLVAVIVLLLGTILGYFVGLRALQASRRLANFRLRQGEVRKARVAFFAGTVLAALAIAALASVQRPGAIPASLPPAVTPTAPPPAATATAPTLWFPPSSTATFFSLTATPAASATASVTLRPSLPISIEAIFKGTVTPAADLSIGTLRFSTEMRGLQPVGPGSRFRNPIKRMYGVFSYQNMQPGTQWTALWYLNGQLKHFETKVWDKASSGLSSAVWEQPPEDWLPGTYELHIFAGTQWKASGSFTLTGSPPTLSPTRTASPSPTASPLPSATLTRTPTPTRTPAGTATPKPTLAASSTASRTVTPPQPEASPSATNRPSATSVPSSTPSSTRTASFTATSAPSATPTPTVSLTPTASPTATPTQTPGTSTVKIYFTNSKRLASRTPPFEEAVERQVSTEVNPISAVLDEYFTGPNAVEQSRGLSAIWNGFIGYRRVAFSDGTLHVYLIGYCRSSGGGYSIAAPLFLTLKQFPGVEHVKLYDEYQRTHDEAAVVDSAPDCLSVPFTPRPTSTFTRLPSPTASQVPTRTPTPTSMPPTRTATPLPSLTPSRVPTATPIVPTATRTASVTPTPTITPLPTRTLTPTITATIRPSATPTPATSQVWIYFTVSKPVPGGTMLQDELVLRQVPSSMNPVVAVLDEYFRGPSAEEQSRGLSAVWSGFVGYRRVDYSNGILEVYLSGRCEPGSTGYSIAQPLTASLKQIPGVRFVKLYDQYDRTRDVLGDADSAPACLDATATPPPSPTTTITPSPTATRRPSATPTRILSTDTATSTRTPPPTKTPTPIPPTWTATHIPPSTTPRPSQTPTRVPTLTATRVPSSTPTRTPPPTVPPMPSATRTGIPTRTAIPTRTPAPTATPRPTETPTAKPSSTPTTLPTATRTPSRMPSATASMTPTLRPTATASVTLTLTASVTPLPSATRTSIPTFTPKPPTPTRTAVPPTETKTPTPVPSATWTASPAATVTRTATPVPSATRTASPPPTVTKTATPVPPSATWTASPTTTLAPSATWTASPSPTATRTQTPAPTATARRDCNRAGFIGDVTIRDLETLPASSAFTKTWRIKNEGTCTWTQAYRLIFVAGTPMDTPGRIALPAPVAPGETIDLSVNLVAPAAPGRYEGYWLLQSPDGAVFGVGRSADQPVWVKIRVTTSPAATPTPTSTAQPSPTAPPASPTQSGASLNLALSGCDAQWAGSAGVLACPGSGSDQAGSVLPLAQASLEDGTISGPALMILLPPAADSYVQGIYADQAIQAGDRLQATVGCAEGAASCSVLFRAGYQDEAGQTHELWSIGEFYDGQAFELDMDLSELAGQSVRFILGVSSLGLSEGDRAIWVNPRLVRLEGDAPTATPQAEPSKAVPGASLTPPPSLAPSATPAPQTPTASPGPLQRLLEAITRFIRQLLGG